MEDRLELLGAAGQVDERLPFRDGLGGAESGVGGEVGESALGRGE